MTVKLRQCGLVALVLLFIVAGQSVHCHWYGDQSDLHSPATIIVDVINQLGLHLLKVHSHNHEDNIAFSPYGVASVLTVLLEGTAGRSALEIQQCGGFPEDRNIIRVGLRDIHRLLRSYFIPQEGFLSGLSLSSEKIKLKPSYQQILRFYGFDMTTFNTPIYPDVRTSTTQNRTTTTTTAATITITTTLDTTTEQMTTEQLSTTTEETVPTVSTTTVKETTPSTEAVTVTSTVTVPTTPTETTVTTETTQSVSVEPTSVESVTTEPSVTESTTTEVQSTTELNEMDRVARSADYYQIAHPYNGPNYNRDDSGKEMFFLVKGKYPEPKVNFMTYNAVLPFLYIQDLDALALRFPLDSPKYYLLLILPTDVQGIERLICDIEKLVTLKQIVGSMRPTFVRAVIPNFMLRGFVILTSSLQKIGIRQIFEPQHADFFPMTDDKDIYVTNIEQAITVTIKNYMESNAMNPNKNLYQYEPIEFKATHPFLYFVMDSETDVTVVTGKIVNPINSRIQ